MFNRYALLFLAVTVANSTFGIEWYVDSVSELRTALNSANRNSVAGIIWVSSGTYQINKPLRITANNLTIRSVSGKRDDVVFQGKGMKKSAEPEIMVDVVADSVTLLGITFQEVANHLIQVRAENDADNFYLGNCTLRNAYEQLLKVSHKKKGAYSDNGTVENCVFEYTAGIGPQFYIGGIDAHHIRNWNIRNNIFRNIASPTNKVAEHAVHIWNDSANNVVENNIIINSDRGIGFGLGNANNQNSGGKILNNVVINVSNHPAADAGIILESSPGTLVEGNIVLMETNYPNAIEYRFPRSKNIVIKNNVTNRSIKSRNGGTAELTNNN